MMGKSLKICRICCQNEGVYCMFQKEESDLQISAKIKYCCPKINIEEGDGLPSRVCEECKGELEVAYQFVIKCESADENLHSLICVTDNEEVKIEVKSVNNDDSDLDREDSLIKYEFEPAIDEEKSSGPIEIPKDTKPILRHKTCKKRTVVKCKRDQVKVNKRLKEYTCIFCGHKSKTKKDSVSHVDKHLSDDGMYQCPKCDKQYKQHRTLLLHYEITHNANRAKMLMCDMCGKEFNTKPNLIAHIRTHTKEQPYSCSQCGKKFSQYGTLASHKQLHVGGRNYHCNICSKYYTTSNSLRVHKKIHNIEPHECNICHKVYKSKKYMNIHVRRYHNDLNQESYVCNFCGKTFDVKINLSGHIKRWHSEKSGVCEICSKNVTDLKNHMDMHAGVKNFKCDECGECFLRALSLANHKVSRHKVHKFKCEECEMSFAWPHLLKHHINKEHKSGFAFPCNLCSRGFHRISDLTKHRRGTHKVW